MTGRSSICRTSGDLDLQRLMVLFAGLLIALGKIMAGSFPLEIFTSSLVVTKVALFKKHNQ